MRQLLVAIPIPRVRQLRAYSKPNPSDANHALHEANLFFVVGVCILASALVWWPASQQAALAHYLLIPAFIGLWIARRRQLPFNWRLLLLAAFLLVSETLGHLACFLGVGWHSSVPKTLSDTLLPSFAGRCLVAICVFFALPIPMNRGKPRHDQERGAQ